jgi:hypothetical protein
VKSTQRTLYEKGLLAASATKKRSERSLEKNGLSKIKSNILPRRPREIKSSNEIKKEELVRERLARSERSIK